VFRRTARGSTCHQLDGFWEGPGFSRADKNPHEPGLQPLRDLPTRRRRRARQKWNRSGRRVAESRLASSRPCAASSRGKPPPKRTLYGTLESKMNAMVKAGRRPSQ